MRPSSVPRRDLPKSERIAKRADFVRAYEQGEKHFGRHIVVFARPNELGHARIGVTATRKVGKANIRNRLKRWVRETYRTHRAELGIGEQSLDFVVNVKNSAATTEFAEFSADLVRVLKRVTRQG